METYRAHSQTFDLQALPRFGFELIHRTGDVSRLSDLFDTSAVYQSLARSGMVIYRDFKVSLEEFNEFVGRNSSKVTLDPARKLATPNTAEIDAGAYEMGLHRENGNLPYSPDIQWFFCLEPAASGSETTFCDGSQVLFELPAHVRKLFERQKLRFRRRIPWSNVQRFLGVELQIPIDTVDDSHLDRVNKQVPGQTYRRIADNLVESDYIVSAITTSKFSGRPAFCNSMLGPSVNYEPPLITWEDGNPIDFEIWDTVKEITARYTYDLFWKKGDAVVLDNTRIMHGRRFLRDAGRRIFGAQSYRKDLES